MLSRWLLEHPFPNNAIVVIFPLTLINHDMFVVSNFHRRSPTLTKPSAQV